MKNHSPTKMSAAAQKAADNLANAIDRAQEVARESGCIGLATMIAASIESGTAPAVPGVMMHYGDKIVSASGIGSKRVLPLEWMAAARDVDDAVTEMEGAEP